MKRAGHFLLQVRFDSLMLILKLALQMELKHATTLRAFKLFDLVFENKLLSKDPDALQTFVKKFKIYATSCIRLLAHLTELRTLGNDIILQCHSAKDQTLPQVVEEILDLMEDNL